MKRTLLNYVAFSGVNIYIYICNQLTSHGTNVYTLTLMTWKESVDILAIVQFIKAIKGKMNTLGTLLCKLHNVD